MMRARRICSAVCRAALTAALAHVAYAQAGPASPVPITITSIGSHGWTSAVVAPITAAARPNERDSVAERVSRCLAILGRPAVPVRSPWAALDSTTAGRPLVLVQLAAPVGPPAACSAATDPLVALAGVELVGPGTRVRADEDLLAADVEMDHRSLAPELVERAEAFILASDSGALASAPSPVHQLRLYFAPDALAPDGAGRFAPLHVRLTTAAAGADRSLVVPDSVIGRSWRVFTEWRLSRLAGEARVMPLPRLPASASADSVLARARLAYDGGDPLRGAALAARRREIVPLARADARLASLLIGSTLLAYGDTAAARAEYREITRSLPCARLDDEPVYDRVLVSTRDPGVRCSRIPLASVFTHGIAPGGAQWVRGDRVGATVAAIATVGLFAIAGERWQQSHSQYQAYTRATAPPLVEPRLDRANATLANARRYAVAGGVAWVASAVAGVVAEWVHPSVESARTTRAREMEQ